MSQSNLFNYDNLPKSQNKYNNFNFPSTRYQGSKLKLCEWIENETKYLDFTTVRCIWGYRLCFIFI